MQGRTAGGQPWLARSMSACVCPLRVLLLTSPRGPEWAEPSACRTHFVQQPVCSCQKVPGKWSQARIVTSHPCFAGFLNYLQMLNFHKLLKTKFALEIILLTMVVVCVSFKNSAIQNNSHDHNVSSTEDKARGSSWVAPLRNAGPLPRCGQACSPCIPRRYRVPGTSWML